MPDIFLQEFRDKEVICSGIFFFLATLFPRSLLPRIQATYFLMSWSVSWSKVRENLVYNTVALKWYCFHKLIFFLHVFNLKNVVTEVLHGILVVKTVYWMQVFSELFKGILIDHWIIVHMPQHPSFWVNAVFTLTSFFGCSVFVCSKDKKIVKLRFLEGLWDSQHTWSLVWTELYLPTVLHPLSCPNSYVEAITQMW